MSTFDKTWHLSQTEDEITVTDFELQLWRLFNGFMRWVEECEKHVNGTNLTGYELSILHIIRMAEKPKSIVDIGRLLNRTDNFNLQYTVKKLIKMGLTEKIEESPNYSKSTMYQLTDAGIRNTDAYTQARRDVLIDMFIKGSDLTLAEMTKTIARLKGIYDEAEQAAAFIKPASKPIKDEKPNKKTKK